jgi:predicted aldo/keto reductase-like oxidoreductase
MRYRDFGRLAWKPSALGFGTMRLPAGRGQAAKLLRLAIDRGVNHIDTSSADRDGEAEIAVGEALRDGYRDRVKVATKAPVALLESPAAADRLLGEQLGRLGLEAVDFYLFQGLDARGWARAKDAGLLGWAEKARAAGRIGWLGFAYHGSSDLFRRVLDEYPGWDFCQLNLNYLDAAFQAGVGGLRLAAERGLPVIAMEPFRAGCLVAPPGPVWEILDRAAGAPASRVHAEAATGSEPRARSPVDWALQWVWNHPEVSLVVAGMGSEAEVLENVSCAERSGAGHLTAEELATIEAAREACLRLGWAECSGCGACEPCPEDVDMQDGLRLHNQAVVFGQVRPGAGQWLAATGAARCTACGECEAKCPAGLRIAERMREICRVVGG